MKKLIALIGVITLLCSVAFPALANGSIGTLLPDIEVLPQPKTTTSSGTNSIQDHIVASGTATPDAKWAAEVKKLIEDFNNPNTTLSVKDMLDALLNLPANSGNSDLVNTLADADFVSSFAQINLNYSGEAFYSSNSKDISVKQRMVYPQLLNLANLDGYMILLINPVNGRFALLDLNAVAENFDSATGAITLNLPFLGIFALIQK